MQLARLFFLFSWLVMHPAISSELPVQKINTSVFSKSGNIYYAQASNHIFQVTYSGKDSSPVLSLNKKIIAFLRTSNHITPSDCANNTEAKYGNQIWIYDIKTKKEKLLITNNFQCNNPEKQIIDPSELAFSPDSKILYFITSAWTTSGALHGVNIDGTQQHYITPANSLEIINKGKYKGYLIVNQHRYLIPPGGSYDWYWLMNPEGKDESPIGEEITSEQRNFIESY